jgi:L,D-transpeptidase catalytic domain
MKIVNPVSFYIVLILLLLAPVLRADSNPNTKSETPVAKPVNKTTSELFAEEVSCLYDEIDLKSSGLSEKAFEYAYKGYKYLISHHALIRSDVISICDFSQSSRNKRLYVVDLEQKKVLINTYVAHGRRSGSEFARSFSNNPESHKSSLGFYITQQTYFGEHGLSLKIRGLEKGFNDKAYKRNIVIHGSEYVGPDFLSMNKFCGRSFGCPAVPSSETDQLIQTIRNGSCLFIYYPTKKYITKSKILNG